MSSEALSEQSCVRKGVGYDEVFPSGQEDPDTSYDNKVLFANSSVKEDKDVDGSEGGSGGDSNSLEVIYVDPPVQFVVGPYGLREFILLPLWTVNDFNSIVKQKHFKTLRARYQILVGIPIRQLGKFEKCYYKGIEDIGVYEKMFKAGLRFPLSALHCRLF